MLSRQAMHVRHYIEVRSRNRLCNGKSISITNSECVSVALGIKHAMRMRHFVIVACPAVPYFTHYLINSRTFQKRYSTQTVCFDFIYKFF
jgi:hypothetical protein